MTVNRVVFPIELGGDGMEVTDDDNPSTGLANGGSILRFIPALRNMVAVARFVIDKLTTVDSLATQAVSDAQAQVNLASQQVELATAQVSSANQYATESANQAGYAKQSADDAKSYLDNLIATAQSAVNTQLTTALGQLSSATTTQTQVVTNLVNQAISQVAQDVAVAVQQASLAQNSASMAQTYAQALIASSNSAVAIGTGNITLTVQESRQFAQGQNLKISHDVNNWMHGEVVNYLGTTLIVAVTVTNGIGTYASWTITISGVQGAKGNDGASLQNLALLWL